MCVGGHDGAVPDGERGQPLVFFARFPKETLTQMSSLQDWHERFQPPITLSRLALTALFSQQHNGPEIHRVRCRYICYNDVGAAVLAVLPVTHW